jgi:hypothetical protein
MARLSFCGESGWRIKFSYFGSNTAISKVPTHSFNEYPSRIGVCVAAGAAPAKREVGRKHYERMHLPNQNRILKALFGVEHYVL